MLASRETEDKPTVTAGVPENGDPFFHEIEELSKALSLCTPMSRTSTDKIHSHNKHNSKWSWAKPLKALAHLHRRRQTGASRDRKVSEILRQNVGDRSKSLRRVGSVPGLKSDCGNQMIVKPDMKLETSPSVEYRRENEEFESEEIDFVVIEKGIEIARKIVDMGGGESGTRLAALEKKVDQNDIDNEVRSAYKSQRIQSRAVSWDNTVDAIADEFLSMLGMEDETPSRFSSFSDKEFPTEGFLDPFEKESIADNRSVVVRDDEINGTSSFGNVKGDVDLLSVAQSVDIKHFKAIQDMECKSRAKMLEEAEAEVLMHTWGLDEKAFGSSRDSRAFGSPIELSP